jgi:hypothetical protein
VSRVKFGVGFAPNIPAPQVIETARLAEDPQHRAC